jgi:hypothetical protein
VEKQAGGIYSDQVKPAKQAMVRFLRGATRQGRIEGQGGRIRRPSGRLPLFGTAAFIVSEGFNTQEPACAKLDPQNDSEQMFYSGKRPRTIRTKEKNINHERTRTNTNKRRMR